MTQEELIAFLLEMRAAQKSFFKTRDYKELKKAKEIKMEVESKS